EINQGGNASGRLEDVEGQPLTVGLSIPRLKHDGRDPQRNSHLDLNSLRRAVASRSSERGEQPRLGGNRPFGCTTLNGSIVKPRDQERSRFTGSHRFSISVGNVDSELRAETIEPIRRLSFPLVEAADQIVAAKITEPPTDDRIG